MIRRRNFRDDGGRGGRSFKRRRYDSEVETTEERAPISLEEQIEALLVQIGEKSTKPLEENLKCVADLIIKSTEKNKMVSLISECVSLIPKNTCIYSTLVGILNVKNFKLSGDIVEQLFSEFKGYLKSCEWLKASTLIKFFADLVNCNVISCGSLMNFFESLVDVTMEDNIPQVRADFYVYSVLSSLPLVGKELSEKKEQDLDQLLNTIDTYITKRNKTHHTALRVWYSDTPHPQEEYLDCLWTQMFKLRSDKWVEKEIIKPYLKLDNILCEALQHNLPQFQPPPHESSNIYPYPRVVFRLFDYTDCPDDYVLPGAHSIERFLIEENLLYIINQHYYDRKECAMALLNFNCEKRIPLEYLIVEVILGELFTLPIGDHIDIYYGSLLLELCKIQPRTLPQVLAQSVELLIERLDTMNIACVDRFAAWFAYHLSNFEFAWSWDESSSCLSLDSLHPKQKFIRETLSLCVRLSYHQKIAESLPETFHILLPEPFSPNNKYIEDDAANIPGFAIAANLRKAFKEKCTPDGALAVIKDETNPLQDGDDGSTFNALMINVFVTELLNVFSKSFTHLFAGIAMYNTCLQTLSTSEDAQIAILKALFEVWNSHQQLLVILTEKLLKAKIINHAAVVNWLFSKEMSSEITKSYVWEILHSAVNTLTIAVEKYQNEVTELKEKMRNSENGEQTTESSITEEMIEEIEDKLETAQSNQKTIFLIIFQRFIMLLSEHIRKYESQGKSFKNHWFRWCIGRLQQVFFQHHKYVFKYVSTLESLLFTSDLDQHILIIFRQFCSIRA